MTAKHKRKRYPQPIYEWQQVQVGWVQLCPECDEKYRSKKEQQKTCTREKCRKRAWRREQE